MKNPVSPVPVECLALLEDASPPRWTGRLRLSGQARPLNVLIFATAQGYAAISAVCPHEGCSLAHCPLHEDDTLVCPAHGMRVGLFSMGFPVYREGEGFFVPLATIPRPLSDAATLPVHETSSDTAAQLSNEIDQLTLANFKKEQQILAITRSMEAMLEESELQKQRLKDAAGKQQALIRFVNRVMDGMDDLLAVIGTDGRIKQVNTAALRELGFEAHELLESPFDDLLSAADRGKLAARLPALPWAVQSVMLEKIRLYNGYAAEHTLHGRGMEAAGVYLLKGNLLHSEQGKLEGAVVTAGNISLLKDRLEHECLLAQRSHGKLAVFFIDLDRFKNVNDTLGHWAGDRLLQQVAVRLKACVRESDTVARLGGDEFTIILSDIEEAGDAADIAQKVIQTLEVPLDINNQQIYISASIGIALSPDNGTDFTTLTKHADAAMYAAKAKGKGTFQYFEAHMNAEAQRRIELESKLRLALENQEFVLFYQPKADTRLHRITGAEALIRWRHPTDGMIAPDRFIPIAEETGLIYPLGKWILRTAFLQAKAWAERFPGFHMAVNLSARQLLADDFIADLASILEETGVSPQWLELEITESLVMHDIETATKRLCSIAEQGIRIAMDDFGTGYSSLSYLQKLPIDILKIDRSFIQEYNSQRDAERAALIKAIIAMGRSLNMQVVAEGVETPQQLELLSTHDCDEIQGYLLSSAMPAAQFEHFHGDFQNKQKAKGSDPNGTTFFEQ